MPDNETENTNNSELLQMTAQVASAYLGNNSVPSGQISEVIKSVHASLVEIGDGSGTRQLNQKPAVPIKKSITPDYVICLEDGKKLKMLKRHLRTTYNLTPDEYRAKWGLPADYPMVAPNYAKQRSQFAKKIGLGRGNRKTKKRKSR